MFGQISLRRRVQLVCAVALAAVVSEAVGLWSRVVGVSLGLFLAMLAAIGFVVGRRLEARAQRQERERQELAARDHERRELEERTVGIDREQAERNMREVTQILPTVPQGGVYRPPHELDDPLTMRMWSVLAERPARELDDIP